MNKWEQKSLSLKQFLSCKLLHFIQALEIILTTLTLTAWATPIFVCIVAALRIF